MENKEKLKSIFTNALKDLGVEEIEFVFKFERIGGRFKTIENSCEVSDTTVYVNEDWADWCLANYQYDLYFLMAHEARHVYQHKQVELYLSNQSTQEETVRVAQWDNEFNNYIRNEGPDTFEAHSKQDVEIDANAYGALFCLLVKVDQPRINPYVEEETTERIKELALKRGIELKESRNAA